MKVSGGPYAPSGVPAGGGGCGSCDGISNSYGPLSGGGCGGACGGGSVMPSNSYGAPYRGGENGFAGGISDTYGARGGGAGHSDSSATPQDTGTLTGTVYGGHNWHKRSSSVNHRQASFQPYNNTEGQ